MVIDGDGWKYLRLAKSKPAISAPGSTAGRQSLCQPHLTQIEAAVVVGLSAQRIYQDLVCDHGFVGSYQAVKRFVRQLRQSQMVAITGRSYRLKDHAAIVGKEDKNKNIKSKSNENSTAESAS